jgi:hypothetical protein
MFAMRPDFGKEPGGNFVETDRAHSHIHLAASSAVSLTIISCRLLPWVTSGTRPYCATITGADQSYDDLVRCSSSAILHTQRKIRFNFQLLKCVLYISDSSGISHLTTSV